MIAESAIAHHVFGRGKCSGGSSLTIAMVKNAVEIIRKAA
jgi:hypothetical protein